MCCTRICCCGLLCLVILFFGACFVVVLASYRIAENLPRLIDQHHLFMTATAIGMMLKRFPAIGRFDLLKIRRRIDAQNLVIITLHSSVGLAVIRVVVAPLGVIHFRRLRLGSLPVVNGEDAHDDGQENHGNNQSRHAWVTSR